MAKGGGGAQPQQQQPVPTNYAKDPDSLRQQLAYMQAQQAGAMSQGTSGGGPGSASWNATSNEMQKMQNWLRQIQGTGASANPHPTSLNGLPVNWGMAYPGR